MPTRPTGYRYCFYFAHHGRGTGDDSQWAEDLTQDAEFAIFDESDGHDLFDKKGHYYGLRRSVDGMLGDLGTQGEQIAKFWNPIQNRPTHGFPLWPLSEAGPANRKKVPAPKDALQKMVEAGLLLQRQYNRLKKGRHA